MRFLPNSVVYLASALVLLATGACDLRVTSEPEDPFPGLFAAVKAELRDPSSAEFKNVRQKNAMPYVCGEVNSRNGFGGYAGWTAFKALRTGNSWMIEWNNSGVPMLEEFFVQDCGASNL